MEKRPAFRSPLRLLLISLVMALVWSACMVVFSRAPLQALLKELGRPGPGDKHALGAILHQFFSAELLLTGALGAVVLALFSASSLWLLVVFLRRR